MRFVAPGSTDQTLIVYAYDESGDAVTLTHASAGLSLSYRRDSNGREGTPVALTPITRAVAGTHQDGAITSKGAGKHEIDLPDAALATGADSVVVELSATAVTGDVYAERVSLSLAAEIADAVVDATAGTGANTITPVVTYNGEPLEGALLSLTLGGEKYTDTTGANGVPTLNVANGTYAVAIAKAGYSFAGATLVVSGDASPPYSMTLNAISTPDDPTLATLVVKCVDEAGAPESGVTVDLRITKIPSSSTGYAFDAKKQTATSGANGVAELTVVRGATYEYRRGTSELWITAVIADAASTTVTSFIGADE